MHILRNWADSEVLKCTTTNSLIHSPVGKRGAFLER